VPPEVNLALTKKQVSSIPARRSPAYKLQIGNGKREMKTRKMKLLIEFDAPVGADFADIRSFIVEGLESAGGNHHPEDPLFHSLGNVHVSKPITAWRDPAKKKSKQITVVPLHLAR